MKTYNVKSIVCGLSGMLLFTGELLATEKTQQIDIGPGKADITLIYVSAATDIQIFYDYDLVRGVTTHAVNCVCTVTEALRRMLVGSGLKAESVNSRTFGIIGKPNCKPWLGADAPLPECTRSTEVTEL